MSNKTLPSLSPFFAVVVGLWVFSFWVFLSGQAPLTSDAVSFYEHVRFYLTNLMNGVYPLWDPLCSCGSPHDFFLRRIGAYNPFLWLIAIPYKLGLSYWLVYGFFLTFTFFLGMFGFYKLVKLICPHTGVAFAAFCLLSFSSLGTRVFDSYIMMFMTPMIWFFYFLLLFGRHPRKSTLMGMTFCLILLMTTYIPFYFLTVFVSFLILFVLIYPLEAKDFVGRAWHFVVRHPGWILLFIFALLLACVPGYLFFKSAGQGTVTMPLRHFDSIQPHVLSVKPDVTSYWAIPEDLLYSSFYLENLKFFNLAVFYVPLFAVIVLLVGMITSIRRINVFLVLWGLFFFILGSPYLTPVYDFLHQHIFFFKYFRNLHFFLWLVILPLLMLLAALQFYQCKEMIESMKRYRWLIWVWVLMGHGMVAAYLLWIRSMNYSTWVTWGMSLGLFIILLRGSLSRPFLWGFLLVVIAVQPLETFHHLSHNVFKAPQTSVYEQKSLGFDYLMTPREFNAISGSRLPSEPLNKNKPFYFGTQWFGTLWGKMNFYVLQDYTKHRLIVYDQVHRFNDEKDDFKIIADAWTQQRNVAFVPAEYNAETGQDLALPALRVEGPTKLIAIIKSDVNTLKLRSDFPTKKFIVFNTSYYPDWQGFVNGQKTTVYRANVAFNGLWVAAGPQIVEFRFGSAWRYGLEISLLIFFNLFFIFFLWQWRVDVRDELKMRAKHAIEN